MARLPTLTRGSLAEAASLRREADDLLNRLLADRESAERRLSETGRRDPIKTVTGSTALERAIASTRDMIADVDLMLRDLNAGGEHKLRAASREIDGSRPQRTRASAAGAARRPRNGMLFGKRPLAASA